MSATKLKKGDTVRVIAGRNKDSEGKILSIDHEKNRVVIEGVNLVTKHEKPTRVGYKVEKNDAGKVVKKTRIAKATGDEIDVVFDKTKK